MDAAARYVEVGNLMQSDSPIAELGAAAAQAQEAAGLERADFVIVAVAPGGAGTVVGELERRAQAIDLP